MNESEFLHNVKRTRGGETSSKTEEKPCPPSCGAACSASDSLVDCHDPSFTVPLDIFMDDTPFSGGEINLASIGSLFIDYVPDWQEKLRELMSKAQKDGTLEERETVLNYYPHWIASSDNAIG